MVSGERMPPSAPMRAIIKNISGDAVVEATILFPIMIMIFAALVLLAIYLPTRAALQRATQSAATALSTEKSDAWLLFDENSMAYEWERDEDNLEFVYSTIFSGIKDAESRGADIAAKIEEHGVSAKSGNLTLDCYVVNWIVYQEVVVTATREFTMPVNLSFVGFPATLPITVSSTSVVQNGDEFVRNIDLAVDFIGYIAKKFGLTDISKSISSAWSKVGSTLGW